MTITIDLTQAIGIASSICTIVISFRMLWGYVKRKWNEPSTTDFRR